MAAAVQSRNQLSVPHHLPSPPSPALSDRTVTQVTIQGSNAPGSATKIIVVADLICGYCFIALREINQAIRDLDRALPAGAPRPRYDIEFRPFFINTTGKQDDVVNRKEYFENRYGAEQMVERDEALRKRGKEVGIDFKFGGKMRQTIRVHRLLFLAYARGGTAMQQALLELLYSSFFEKEQDVTDVKVLAGFAAKIGLMPVTSGEAWLKSKAGEEEVRKLARISADCGISGVPFAVVDGKWAISGGMERNVYFKTLEKLAKGEMKQ